MSKTAITRVSVRPFDVELTASFGIATGSQDVARNVLVEVELADGTTGLGEAAPFPAVNGETREAALGALGGAEDLLVGLDARRWRHVLAAAAERLTATPSALAAVDSAVLDALCRHQRLSLWAFFGGAVPELESDLTLVTGDVASTAAAAAAAARAGFRTLKVKVGGAAPADDAARLAAVEDQAPGCRWILDANTAWSLDDVLELLGRLGPLRARVALLEQPAPADDLETPRRLRERTGLLVAADEGARSARDVAALAAAGAADVINLKVTKTGVVEALAMAATARAHGLGLMIGGMVETAVTMNVSACLAAGLGGFGFVDLDTPLFMKDAPFSGGYAQSGPRLVLGGVRAGHGVSWTGAPITPAP